MNVLVDTQALLWAVDEPSRLGPVALVALRDPSNSLYLSAATIWEIAIKVGLKKLTLTSSYQQWMNAAVAALGLQILPINIVYSDALVTLPLYHRDPFDRLIIVHAIVEQMPVVSNDTRLDPYGVTRIW